MDNKQKWAIFGTMKQDSRRTIILSSLAKIEEDPQLTGLKA